MKSYRHQSRHHTEDAELFTFFVQENCCGEKMNAAERANVAHLALFRATRNSCPISVPQRHYSYTTRMDGWADGWTNRQTDNGFELFRCRFTKAFERPFLPVRLKSMSLRKNIQHIFVGS
jgi:hypothetical protein